MKIKAFASLLALFLLGLTTAQLASAQTAGQSASGNYQFSFEDGYTKYLEFNARTQADGSATGEMTLTDEAELAFQDVDGTGDPSLKDSSSGFFVKAEFDGLLVDKNRAVMSGTVRDSSIRSLIGLRVLLTVEDNGTDMKNPDKVSWGLYEPTAGRWATADAERKEDPGVGLRWVAADAERKDDEGVTMPGNYSIDSKTFPLSSYSFVNAQRWAGDIQVRS
jgi:hypothetical protein